MRRRFMRRIPVALGVLCLVGMVAGVAGCGEKEKSTGCGNGLRGIGEDCDCGTDPDNLPDGCLTTNGGPGATCSTTCEAVLRENCDNGVDDDKDGLVDCADDDCATHARCLPETLCNDRLDNDGDGDIDCDDSDCATLPVCEPENCTNGVDDNGDGFIDCQDAQCVGVADCIGVEVCWGGVDDDGDGYTDCDDSDCVGESVCAAEDCANGLDDDGDFKVDCADRSCIESAECPGTGCGSTLINSSVTLALSPGNQVARVALQIDAETDDSYGQCDVTNGKEHVLEIRLLDPGRLRVVYSQSGAHRFGLYFKGRPGAGCHEAMNACTVPAVNAGGVLEYGALPASEYYLIVSEDSAGSGGAVDLVISLVDSNPANVVELCDNLLDDDGDSQYDCGDLTCLGDATCDQSACGPGQLPVPDHQAGSLAPSGTPLYPMPGADPPLLEVNTQGGGSNYPVTGCQGLFGQDQMISFTLQEPAVIQVGFRQNMSDAGDHVLALFFEGQDCALAEHWCIDPGGVQDGVVTFPGDPADGGRYPAGNYYLVTKSMGGSAGRIDLQIITLNTTAAELCIDAGFDNDGDGDRNCDDADCFDHHSCILEDCSDQNPSTGDLDLDGRVGCQDTDPDDRCVCSYVCACAGQPGCDPADLVCDGDYDDEVIDFGTVHIGQSYPFVVDTSLPGVRGDYFLETCLGTVDSTAPDVVLFFTLATTSDIRFDFIQPAGVVHRGLFMHADRCRACDDLGPAEAYSIYCYSTNTAWLQYDLLPGSYALVLKAMPSLSATGLFTGEFLTGQFSGDLVISP